MAHRNTCLSQYQANRHGHRVDIKNGVFVVFVLFAGESMLLGLKHQYAERYCRPNCDGPRALVSSRRQPF